MVLLPRRVSSEKAGATGLCGWESQQSFWCRDSLGEGCRFGCLQPTGVQYVDRSPWGGASPDARTCWEPAEGEKEDPLLHPLAGVCPISACSDPCSWACCVASSQHVLRLKYLPRPLGLSPFLPLQGLLSPGETGSEGPLEHSCQTQGLQAESGPPRHFMRPMRASKAHDCLSRSAFLLLSNQWKQS